MPVLPNWAILKIAQSTPWPQRSSLPILFKNGPSPALFSVFFKQFWQQINVKNNIPVYSARSRTHDLLIMGLLHSPLDQGSHPLTYSIEFTVFVTQSGFLAFVKYCFLASVTRFGEISPLLLHFMNVCQMVDGLFCVWQILEPTLAKMLCFWEAFQCFTWPNIEKL